MGGGAVFGEFMHLARADLHLYRVPVGAGQHRVQGSVAVVLGKRDVVLEPLRHRAIGGVQMPERLVAMHRGVHDDAKRHDVRDLFQRHGLLALHLGPDGMRALAPARDLGLEAGLLKRLRQRVHDSFDLAAAFTLEQLESL